MLASVPGLHMENGRVERLPLQCQFMLEVLPAFALHCFILHLIPNPPLASSLSFFSPIPLPLILPFSPSLPPLPPSHLQSLVLVRPFLLVIAKTPLLFGGEHSCIITVRSWKRLMYHVHVSPYLYRDFQCLCPYGLLYPTRAPCQICNVL